MTHPRAIPGDEEAGALVETDDSRSPDMSSRRARRVVIIAALLSLISTPAVGADLEATVDLMLGLEMGRSLEDLQERFPDLEAAKIDSENEAREIYLISWDHPLLPRVALGVRGSRLRSLSAFNGSLDGGWEAADAVVRYGPTLLERISERWGPPRPLLTRRGHHQTITATWRRQGEVLRILMTAPDQLLAQAGQNRNPSASFAFARFVEDQEPDLKQQLMPLEGEGSSITIDDLAVDYDAYRARMEVRPRKRSAKCFPAPLQGVYIGMPTSELREVRPGLASGDFYDDRYSFFDRVREGEVQARYRARMDRLVAVVFSDPEAPDESQGISEAWQDWLVRNWGTPDYIRWRLYTTTQEGRSTKESIFVWEHRHCDSAVAVAHRSQRVIRLAVFEPGLDPGLNFAGFGIPQRLGTTDDEATVLTAWKAFLEEKDRFPWPEDDPAAPRPEERRAPAR
jgi:hypothetical protein